MSERDSRPLTILGIETSCDETAAAIVRREGEARGTILSSIVRSQNQEHEAYGGVVPEIAARAHVEALDGVIDRARRQAGLDMADIDAIAATAGPGLIGGLIVGLMTAKAMAAALGKPLLAINHLEGHALTVRLTDNLDFPFLLLLVSGGHTQLLSVIGVGRYRRLGTTIDDALGEAYDKTAKLLGLAGPGGPAVEAMALTGDAKRFTFPRPLLGKESLDFSFSGLKSAVRRMAEATAPLEHRDIADLCAGFQAAILDILRDKVARAIDIQGPAPLVVAGGVAANRAIRSMLEDLATEKNVRFVAPPIDLCGDNAAMIAWAGAERLAMGETSPFDMPPRARWPLDEAAVPRIGSGRKGGKA